MPRKKKKDISINVETKHVDAQIERKDNNLTIDIDTPIIDVEIERKDGKKTKIKITPDLKPFRNTRIKSNSYS